MILGSVAQLRRCHDYEIDVEPAELIKQLHAIRDAPGKAIEPVDEYVVGAVLAEKCEKSLQTWPVECCTREANIVETAALDNPSLRGGEYRTRLTLNRAGRELVRGTHRLAGVVNAANRPSRATLAKGVECRGGSLPLSPWRGRVGKSADRSPSLKRSGNKRGGVNRETREFVRLREANGLNHGG